MNNNPLSLDERLALDFDGSLLNEKVILITGAGDGIGKTAAKTFASFGARVILAGRTTAKLENVHDEILAAGNLTPWIYPIDLQRAEEEDYLSLGEAIQKKIGSLDGLLLNAGVLGARRPISNYLLSDWDQCLQVNLRSQFMMIKALLPILEKSTNGKILFTSSEVGKIGKAHWGAYSVSKFATEGLAQILADELDGVSNIDVNTINPGATKTKMRAKAYPAENPETLKTAEKIMPTYLYFISNLSKGISGCSINAQ